MRISHKILIGILFLAFLLRIAGIGFGLPLIVVDDEPPFTLAALKMMELKTLVPALHDEFKDILYYPPYLSYILLPLFLPLVLYWLIRTGDVSSVKLLAVYHSSLFFLIARFLTIAFGVLSVYFIYRFVENVFRSERAALWAAFFSATSALAVSLASVARHWTPVLLIFSLVLFFLSQPNWSVRKRYAAALLTVGAGFGASIISLFALPLIFFWFLLYDRRRWREIFSRTCIAPFVVVLGALFVLPLALYPARASLGFAGEIGLHLPPILSALASPFVFGKWFFFSDTLFVLAALAGLILVSLTHRTFFWFALASVYAYALVFLVLFRFEARFFLPLLPLFAALAGFAFSRIRLRVSVPVALLMLAIAARLALLAAGGDTREAARQFVENNLSADARIVSYGKGLRLRTLPTAVAEQETLDSASLRQVDRAEAALPDVWRETNHTHTLNLYTVQNDVFWENLDAFLTRGGYDYLLLASDSDDARALLLKEIGESRGEIIWSREGSFNKGINYGDGVFGKQIGALFGVSVFGPDMILYQLK